MRASKLPQRVGIARAVRVLSTSARPVPGVVGVAPRGDITSEDVVAAQTAWSNAITGISKVYQEGGDFVAAAGYCAGELYGYGHSNVLFKPTRATNNPFRPTGEDAMAYFVGAEAMKNDKFKVRASLASLLRPSRLSLSHAPIPPLPHRARTAALPSTADRAGPRWCSATTRSIATATRLSQWATTCSRTRPLATRAASSTPSATRRTMTARCGFSCARRPCPKLMSRLISAPAPAPGCTWAVISAYLSLRRSIQAPLVHAVRARCGGTRNRGAS